MGAVFGENRWLAETSEFGCETSEVSKDFGSLAWRSEDAALESICVTERQRMVIMDV